VATARHLLIDGLIGQAKAYRQVDRREESFRCLLEVLHLSHFEPESKRHKAEEMNEDVIFHSPSGHVYAVQLKGPYAEQVQELLSELAAGRSPLPGTSSAGG
jgi:hypothetical protein